MITQKVDNKKLLQFIRQYFKVPDDMPVTGGSLLKDLSKTVFDIGMLPEAVSEEFNITIDDDDYRMLCRDKARVKRYFAYV